MTGATEALARYAADAPASWPEEARHGAERAFVDTIACILAGRADGASGAVSTACLPWSGSGGRSFDFVSGRPVAAPFAALANGTAAHALDYDDVLEPAAAHASAVFVPALLALGQERNVSGRQLVDALIVCFDVMNALAAAMNYAHYARGWHTTLTLGAPAAAAGCARLLGFDVDQTRKAIGGATSFSSGSKRQFGTQMKPTHAGMAAQAGILAASFAEQNLTAAEEILEGPWSFGDLFGADGMPGFAAMHDALRAGPALARPGAWIKAYPCCASAHRPIDALLDLQRSHGFEAESIQDVEAHVSDVVMRNLMYQRPRNEMEARFSLNHCLAVAATRGSVTLADFSLPAISEPALRSFWPKVRMTRDPNLPATMEPAWGAERCRLVVTLANGTQVEQTVVFPRGHPGAPLSDADLARKFEDCAGDALTPSAAAVLLERLFALEREPNLDGIMELLSSQPPTTLRAVTASARA